MNVSSNILAYFASLKEVSC